MLAMITIIYGCISNLLESLIIKLKHDAKEEGYHNTLAISNRPCIVSELEKLNFEQN